MIFQQVINLFHRNNKTRHQDPKIISEKLEKEESIATVSTLLQKEEPEPQVEFEQSRFLLEMDFFHEPQEHIKTSFPQFDHLLQPKEEPVVAQDTTRNFTKTLRHRISIYRPQQSVKKSRSTPIFE